MPSHHPRRRRMNGVAYTRASAHLESQIFVLHGLNIEPNRRHRCHHLRAPAICARCFRHQRPPWSEPGTEQASARKRTFAEDDVQAGVPVMRRLFEWELGGSDAALAEWWYEPSADCSVLALESPSLGELLVSMGRERARRVAANGTGAGDAQHEPQLLTMYRESVANASNPRRWRCG